MSEIGNGLKLTAVPGSQPMINKALSPSIFDNKMTLSTVDNDNTSPNGNAPTGNTSSTVAPGTSPEGAMNIVNDIKTPMQSNFSSELKVYIIPEDEPEGFLPDI